MIEWRDWMMWLNGVIEWRLYLFSKIEMTMKFFSVNQCSIWINQFKQTGTQFCNRSKQNLQGMQIKFVLLASIMITSSRMAQLSDKDTSVVYRDKSAVAQKLQKFIESGIQNFQVQIIILYWIMVLLTQHS